MDDLYIKQPDPVAALKFEGGAKSAKKFIRWLMLNYRACSAWTPQVKGPDGFVISGERIIIAPGAFTSVSATSELPIFPGQWIVIEAGGEVETMGNAQFTHRYKSYTREA